MHDDKTVLSQRRPPAALIVEEGPEPGTTFPLSGNSFVIGRGKDVEISLSDNQCSRHHATIMWASGQFFIQDLGSSNGTFVNNEPVTKPRELFDGDRIRLGKVTLLLQIEEVQVDKPLEKILRDQGIVPSRHVLTTASEMNQQLGHENLGFLSESHGVIPHMPPLLELPAGYEAWDELVEMLPEMFRTLSLRKTFDAMPVLSAAEKDLADRYLLRASVILSMFAHSYIRIDSDPDPSLRLPKSIQQPWEEVSRRLNRPGVHLSYIDLIVYNWRLIDPTLADPVRLENLELLVPSVDNKEERILYLAQVEMLAKSTPIVSAVVRAQEAVHRDDANALKEELIIITEALQHVANKSFMKINPNAHSDTPLDPVVFAKTVAPFAVPINEGVAGAGGAASPIFHILDSFFSRSDYNTRLGGEMLHQREWYPKHWQDFINALGQVSVLEYVDRSRSKTLKGIFKDATQAYFGDSSYLSRHRLKAYGFLDIGFKVGRNQTIGGFSGLFKDRTWDLAVFELTTAHEERRSQYTQTSHFAEVKEIRDVGTKDENWVKQIVLDVKGTGIRYQPGDRCGILPENSNEIVAKTLRALRARGIEPIQLNAQWREAVTLRYGYEDTTTLPLRSFLTFGRIRPVDRNTAKLLYSIAPNETLKRIIEARMEDQWELWDLLQMLAEGGFNPKRLWKAHPGEEENICHIVPPEQFRMYSVSSVMESNTINGASELHLTVGRLQYDTPESDFSIETERLGTGSNYLGDTVSVPVEDMGQVALKTVQPPRFSMPQDEQTPIVMFAGGTGLSPFRSFIQERARQANPGETWLFFGTRAQADFLYQDEMKKYVAQGRLNVRVAFSRDDVQAKFVANGDGGDFVFEPGKRGYIGDEMLREENARALWELLLSRHDGGLGAYFYVCGRTSFANTVMDAIKEIVFRYSEGTEQEKEQTAQRVLYRLAGEERYLQEIFTTYTGSQIEKQQLFDASEVALHNNEQDGYWMIVNGRVYDLTEFAQLHPGGFKIIAGYAGMDATVAYQSVLHHENSEVDAMLGMYEIGAVRRLNFGGVWGVAIGPNGLQYVSLANTFRAWVRLLFNTIEMQNALDNDYTIRLQALTRGEDPMDESPYKTQMLIEIHQRFMLNYRSGAMGDQLHNLWAATAGLCDPNADVRWMQNTIDALQQTEEGQVVERLGDDLAERLANLVERNGASDGPSMMQLAAYCDLMEDENKRFLNELKLAMREGVRIFEEYEHATIDQGNEHLQQAIRKIPGALEAYYGRMFAGVQAIERQNG